MDGLCEPKRGYYPTERHTIDSKVSRVGLGWLLFFKGMWFPKPLNLDPPGESTMKPKFLGKYGRLWR